MNGARGIRIRFVVFVVAAAQIACCTHLKRAPSGEVVTEPAVIIRGVIAGWIIGQLTNRPRKLDTWEVRIAPDGMTQEGRGWRSADGFLPPRRIAAAEAQRLIRLAGTLSDLPEYVGRVATDTPFREIEIHVDGSMRTIHAYPALPMDHDAMRFDDVWNEIGRHFPETRVCR